MEQNTPNRTTSLRIPDIKTYLYETVGKIIEATGYKFKKSNFSFVRKHGKDYEEIYFLFYNYFPLNYDFHFSLLNWNTEIQNIKKVFPYQQNIDNFGFSTLIIPMGDFVEESKIRDQLKKHDTGFVYDGVSGEFIKDDLIGKIKDLTWAQIAGHSYEVVTSKDLFESAEDMKKLLEEQVLPLANQLSTLEGIDNFFAGRPGWSVNSLSLNNMASELVAAKLNGKRDYHDVFKQIVEVIDERIATKGMSQETRRVIEELYKYLQKS